MYYFGLDRCAIDLMPSLLSICFIFANIMTIKLYTVFRHRQHPDQPGHPAPPDGGK